MPLASFFMTLSHVSCAMRHPARNWTSCALAKARCRISPGACIRSLCWVQWRIAESLLRGSGMQ